MMTTTGPYGWQRKEYHPLLEGRPPICRLALDVETTYFIYTDPFHVVSAPISMLRTRDNKVVVPYLDLDSKYCQSDPSCPAGLQRAQMNMRSLYLQRDLLMPNRTFFYAPDSLNFSKHYDTYDTMFVTDVMEELCTAWDGIEGRGESNCSSRGPSADDYMYFVKMVGLSESNASGYHEENREVKGWRKWSTLHTPHPENECFPDYSASDVNVSYCARFTEGLEDACDAEAECSWRPIFQSGKCRPRATLVDFADDRPTPQPTPEPTPEPTPQPTPAPQDAIATVLVTLQKERVYSEPAAVLEELTSAVEQAVQSGDDSAINTDVQIQLTEDSSMPVPPTMTEAERQAMLDALRVGRCGTMPPTVCDVAETGSSEGLRATEGAAQAGRRLQAQSILQFTVFLIIRDAADLEETNTLDSPEFVDTFMRTLPVLLAQAAADGAAASANDTNASNGSETATGSLLAAAPLWGSSWLTDLIDALNETVAAGGAGGAGGAAGGNDTQGTAGGGTATISIFAPPVASALTVIKLTAPDQVLDMTEVNQAQQDVGDGTAITARIHAVSMSSAGTSLITAAPPIVDLCLGRTCGGHGTCVAGNCICDPGWSVPNCHVFIITSTSTTSSTTTTTSSTTTTTTSSTTTTTSSTTTTTSMTNTSTTTASTVLTSTVAAVSTVAPVLGVEQGSAALVGVAVFCSILVCALCGLAAAYAVKYKREQKASNEENNKEQTPDVNAIDVNAMDEENEEENPDMAATGEDLDELIAVANAGGAAAPSDVLAGEDSTYWV